MAYAHKYPATQGRTGRGLGGGNRWMHVPVPNLPYESALSMFPSDTGHIWSPAPHYASLYSQMKLELPHLRTVPLDEQRANGGVGVSYVTQQPNHGGITHGMHHVKPQSTFDRATVPENSRGFHGGTFLTKPSLYRGGLWQ